MDNIREIMKTMYSSQYVGEVLESASKREGCACKLCDNPITGVFVTAEDEGSETGRRLVELTEGEKTLLLIEVGKSFSALSRL